jgi:hypothetical protein
MGAMILQMLTHTVYTHDELQNFYKMHSMTRDEIAHKTHLLVYKYPPVLLDILEICLSPVESPVIEPQKGYNTPHIRMKCPISRLLLGAMDELRQIVLKYNEDIEWVRPVQWTDEDEFNRREMVTEKLHAARELAISGKALSVLMMCGLCDLYIVAKILLGRNKAIARLMLEAKKTRFELLPQEVQIRIIKRRKAIAKSKENKAERRWFIKQAQFRHWKAREMTIWIADALTSSYRDAYIAAKKQGKFVRPTAEVMNRKQQEQANRLARLLSDKQAEMFAATVNSHVSANSTRAEKAGPGFSTKTDAMASGRTSPGSMASTKSLATNTLFNMSGKSLDSLDAGSSTKSAGSVPSTAASEKEEKKVMARRNLQFLFQRIQTLMDPPQEWIEKILLNAGHMFHGRKAFPTPYETDIDQDNLYKEVGLQCAKCIVARLAASSSGHRGLYAELINARRKADSRLNHSTLATQISEEALRLKKLLVSAELVAKNLPVLRQGVLDYSKETDIHDRNWAKRQVMSVSMAIVEKFENTEWIRHKGEMLASAKINALYRQWKTRKLVTNVWVKADLALKDQLAQEKEEWQRKIASGEISIEIPDFEKDAQQAAEEDEEMNNLEPVQVTDCTATEDSIEVLVTVDLGVSRFGKLMSTRQHATCVGCVLVQPPWLPDVVSNEIQIVIPKEHKDTALPHHAGSASDGSASKGSASALTATQQLRRNAAGQLPNINQISGHVAAVGPPQPDYRRASQAGHHGHHVHVPSKPPLTAKDFEINPSDLSSIDADSTSDISFDAKKTVDILSEGHGELVLILYDARQLTDVKDAFRKYLPAQPTGSGPEGSGRSGSVTGSRRGSGFLPRPPSSPGGAFSGSYSPSGSPGPGDSPGHVSVSPAGNSSRPGSLANLAAGGGGAGGGRFSPGGGAVAPKPDISNIFPVEISWLGPKQDEELMKQYMKERMIAIQTGAPMPDPPVSDVDVMRLLVRPNGGMTGLPGSAQYTADAKKNVIIRPFANYRVRVIMSDIFLPRIESQRNNFDVYAFVKVSKIDDSYCFMHITDIVVLAGKYYSYARRRSDRAHTHSTSKHAGSSQV